MNRDESAIAHGNGSADQGDAVDHLLADYLEKYDDALARGETPCHPDETLLAGELLSEFVSLAGCIEVVNQAARDGGLSGGIETLRASENTAHIANPDGSLAGERIGRFEIVRELGRGGFGVVFLARDLTLHRDVAIKLPRPEALVTPELRKRFLREAQAASRLDHPHVVPVFEVGEDGGLCYIVSPYCRGPSLARWLQHRSTPVNVRDAAQLISSIAHGLEDAHRAQVLHRDIKPSNILLDLSAMETGAEESTYLDRGLSSFVPKLSDFGLARLTEAARDQTRSGALLGTPAYMAPEQAVGRANETGFEADIYALGAILYEMLTGQLPFAAASDAETLQRVVTSEAAMPRTIRREIPRDLEAICLKCLEKSPEDRYLSAGLLADDLGRFLSGKPTEARPGGVVRRSAKWIRRHKPLSALATAVTLLVASLAVLGSWSTARIERETKARLEKSYTNDMRAAFEARSNGNAEQVASILARYDEGTPGASERHFEWYWLRRSLNEVKQSIPARHGEAYAVAFSPDAKLLLSGGEDGIIRGWNHRDGSLAFELRGHRSCVNQLAFSHDGNLLASASCDRTVRLWDATDWRDLGVLGEYPREIVSLAFAHTRPWLATGSHDQAVRVWNLATRKLVATLGASRDNTPNDALAFRADDEYLAVAGPSCAVWETENWTEVQRYPASARAAGFTDKSHQLLLGTNAHEVVHWEIGIGSSPRVVGHVAGEPHHILSLPESDVVLTAADNGSVRAFGMDHPVHRVLFGGTARLQDLAISQTSDLLAAASHDGTLRLWGLSAGVLEHATSAWSAAISPRSDYAAVLLANNRQQLHRLVDGSLQSTVDTRSSFAGFSPQGTYVVLVGETVELRPVRSLDIQDSATITTDRPPVAVSISNNEKVVALLQPGGLISVYEIPSGRKLCEYTLPVHRHVDVEQIALNTDGSLLVWITDGVVSTLGVNTTTGREATPPSELSFLANATIYPHNCKFSPDGSRALVASSVPLLVRDVRSSETFHQLRHRRGVSGNVAWTPDGRRLAVATLDNTIALFDPQSGEEVGELDGCLTPIISNLVFSSDGQSLMTVVAGPGGQASRIHVWDATK